MLLFFCSQGAFAQSDAVDTAYLWRQALGGAVVGRPTVQAQSVVMVLDGGNIKAYSSSGRPLWNFSARGRLSPYVTRSREGTSYICRTNGIFIAVNRIGRELWRTNIGGALAGAAVLGWDGRVFIPTAQKILCYTAAGNLLWTLKLEGNISAGPWLDQAGGIMVALDNGHVLRIDPYGATALWHLSSIPRILLSVKNTSGALSILALFPDGNVQLIESSQTLNLPRLPAPPLAAESKGGNVAVALANGQLALLSGANGAIQWTADTRVPVGNATAVIYDERGIYMLNSAGAVGFTADGRRLWFTILTNATGLPALDDEGVLYSGGTDWILYAWKVEENSLKQKRTLYGPAPEGSYHGGISPLSMFTATGYYDETIIQRELSAMSQEIQEGRVGENEREWLAWLMDIAVGGVRPGSSVDNLPRTLITHRILALQLLARIGSSENIPWLTRFFRMEEEPLVKATAARAIGGIGVDPNGIALQSFLAATVAGNPARDEQVLIAVAAATGELCRFSGPPLFNTGSRILVLLSSVDQPASVQRQALHELESLASP